MTDSLWNKYDFSRKSPELSSFFHQGKDLVAQKYKICVAVNAIVTELKRCTTKGNPLE